MDVLFSASILASFFAGMVALFAPCCITILLPTYLAAAFRERSAILKMTFVYFAGIAVILVPVGLGAAGLASVFERFHDSLYIVGGILMVAFAILSIMGKSFTLIPMPKKFSRGLNVTHPKSVFLLGILSGAATSCCAPVLAGALTLAVVSGAFWKAVIVTLAYTFGMTFPLFICAYFYERFNMQNSRLIRGKLMEAKIGRKTYFVHSTNLLAGVIFLTMGIILLILGVSKNAYWSPAYQEKISGALNRISLAIFNKIAVLPDWAWGLILGFIFLFLVYRTVKHSRGGKRHEG